MFCHVCRMLAKDADVRHDQGERRPSMTMCSDDDDDDQEHNDAMRCGKAARRAAALV